MRRLAALFLLLAACGGAGADTSIPPEVTSPSTVATTTTSVPGASATTGAVPTTEGGVAPAGDPAPDFTLQLGEGGSFTLSEHGRPVYLLFWAEW